MGQQRNKVIKRRRRADYLKRKKEQAKLGGISRKAFPKSESTEATKAPAKKAPAKKAAAKKAAKKAPAKKAAKKAEASAPEQETSSED